MELEKEWWKNPLVLDIHASLRKREMTLPVYNAQSPQIHLRRYLIDWLATVVDYFEFCLPARHLAVYLADFFMDRYDIDEQQLHLVMLGALLVAIKFEETEINIPKTSDLDKRVPNNNSYSLSMYLQMELVLLKCFDWNVYWPTPAHFIDYYLCSAVDETDVHGGQKMSSLEMAKTYLSRYAAYFLEVSLQDHVYRKYYPSIIAASCIAASRICLSITPHWPERLQTLTDYQWKDIEPCIHNMMITHEFDERASAHTPTKPGRRFVPDTPPEAPPIGGSNISTTTNHSSLPVMSKRYQETTLLSEDGQMTEHYHSDRSEVKMLYSEPLTPPSYRIAKFTNQTGSVTPSVSRDNSPPEGVPFTSKVAQPVFAV